AFRRIPAREEALPGFAWAGGAAVVVIAQSFATRAVPLGPAALALAIAGLCSIALATLPRRARRVSQAARLAALFLALAAPSLAFYPSLSAFGTARKEQIIESEYAPQALTQRDELRSRLYKTLDEIDAMPTLADFVRGAPGSTTERALAVWSMTDLALYRLTSAIELYNADGTLVSRFALNLPEYTTPRHETTSCDWEVFEE